MTKFSSIVFIMQYTIVYSALQCNRVILYPLVTLTQICFSYFACTAVPSSSSASPSALGSSSSYAAGHHSALQNAHLPASVASSNALVFSLQCPRPPLSLAATSSALAATSSSLAATSSAANPTVLTPQMPAALPPPLPPGTLNPISHPPPLTSQPSKR